MRLHSTNERPRASRIFELYLEDDDRPEQMPTAARGRKCPVCGALLSVYNLDGGDLCWQCEKRADEPLSTAQLEAIFVAVVNALTATWDDADADDSRCTCHG
jgi:hypothetical protein